MGKRQGRGWWLLLVFLVPLVVFWKEVSIVVILSLPHTLSFVPSCCSCTCCRPFITTSNPPIPLFFLFFSLSPQAAAEAATPFEARDYFTYYRCCGYLSPPFLFFFFYSLLIFFPLLFFLVARGVRQSEPKHSLFSQLLNH